MDYEDLQIAQIYDAANPWSADLEFYTSLAGESAGQILDLGCGTGTLCCALAARGHRVTGVEPAAAMLAMARHKACADRVEWVQTNAQSYRSDKRFDWIVMTGHAFQCLLTDDEMVGVLATMRSHLAPQGIVAFETRNPNLDWATEWSSRPATVYTLPDGEPCCETLEITGCEAEFISFQTNYRIRNRVLTTRSRLRFPTREHVVRLINGAGLRMRESFGDWNGGSFDAERSREIIFVAERSE